MGRLASRSLGGNEGSSTRVHPGDSAVNDEAIGSVVAHGSMYGLLRASSLAHASNPMVGYRCSTDGEYKFITYAHAHDVVTRLARTLISDVGLEPGECIGVYGKNCPSWVITQYAVNAAGGVLVPIYDTLGSDIVRYLCEKAEISVIFVSLENYPKVRAVRTECPTVRSVVVFDHGAVDATIELSQDAPVSDTTLFTLISSSTTVVDSKVELPDRQVDDTYVVMFSSGTTGNPKGVVLTNGNVLSGVGSALAFFVGCNKAVFPSDVYLSFLPLAHIYEQQFESVMISRGARIGFYSGNIKLLLSDMQALKPTLFCGVPRVFARFQQRIEEAVAAGPAIRRILFRTAMERQLLAVQNRFVLRSALWDTLVFRKIRASLLPRARLVITGSAPMSTATNDFLKVALQCPVVQGYGLTESVGGVLCTAPGGASGTCGGPFPGCEVRLHDLPNMGYTTKNNPPQGEVCLRGPMIFKEYYTNEEETSKALDKDGWFHTGDVGQWNKDGSLQIIDRAKNLFKLAQGEYVSPETLENEYAKAPLVLQIFVYGSSLEATLLAVVVPDAVNALKWGKPRGCATLNEVVQHAEFKQCVLNQLLEAHKTAKFNSYEKIRDVIIEIDDRNELGQGFHSQNGLATPTFKLRRPQLRAKYKKQLDHLYATRAS